MNVFFYLVVMMLCFIPGFSSAFQLTRMDTSAIVIPEYPNSVEQTAAMELQNYVEKVAGIKLPIITENRVTTTILGGFCLGNTLMAQKHELDISKKAPDFFTLQYHDNFLYIIGKDGNGPETNVDTAAGTLFGVYHYLNHALGVKWLWPGITGEYIPAAAYINLNSEFDGAYPPSLQFARASQLEKDTEAYRWGRRVMHMSGAGFIRHAGTNGHAFSKWAELYGKEHPDWFAMLNNGKRSVRAYAAMCVSNDAFQDQIVKNWQTLQSKSPTISLALNVKENDTTDRCCCISCLALDGPDKRGPTARYQLYRNVGERYAAFYRKVQEKAAKFVPDAKVSFYAYQSYFYAPRKTKLNAYCYVGIVPDIPFPRRPEYNQWLQGEYNAWQASGATLYLRTNNFIGGYCMPEVWYDQYASEFKSLRNLGCIGVVIDGPGMMWAARGLDYYVMARLCANSDANPASLVAEYTSSFGAAAPEIATYMEFWRDYLQRNTGKINSIYEKSVRRWYFHGFHYAAYAHIIFPAATLEQGRKYLDAAATKVVGNASASAKVDFLRQGLEYAIASSKCAALFAAPDSTVTARKQAWTQLHEMREKLPRHAVNMQLLDRIEKNVWSLTSQGKPEGDTQALSEMWLVRPDPEGQGIRLGYAAQDIEVTKWSKASTWKTLEMQGFTAYKNMWYRTKVYIPEQSSKHVFLHLGAVDESCEVWVNGHLVGRFNYDVKKDPNSWEKPFELDITPHVKFGLENLLCVKVENNDNVGGLWKPSYLIYRGKE